MKKPRARVLVLAFVFAHIYAGAQTVQTTQARPAESAPPYLVQGDGISQALSAIPGDSARGREIVLSRSGGLCLLCHSAPVGAAHNQGNIAPSLAGVGARLSAAQLRLRLVEPQRLNPATIMPAYLQTQGLQQVGAAWVGRPLLSPQQIEDVVAFLLTLKL